MKTFKTVALEDLMVEVIMTFCENLSELNCPRDAEPDIWFRELSLKKQRKIAEKMLDIVERNDKIYQESLKIDK